MARRSSKPSLPPPLEMACLGVIWTLQEATVRDVASALAERQQFAYTTVMTLLDRLVRRGHLERRKVGRRFVYTPAKDPAELREIAIAEFVRDYFGGSRDALRLWLDAPVASTAESAAAPPQAIDTTLL
jgi:predicted transcriptional regulator